MTNGIYCWYRTAAISSEKFFACINAVFCEISQVTDGLFGPSHGGALRSNLLPLLPGIVARAR